MIITAIVGVVLVAAAFAFGVGFGRKNPKKVEKAVAEIKSVEDKVKKIF